MRIWRSKARRRELKQTSLFLLPSLAGVCLFMVFPMADTVRRSFTSIGGAWVGMANYRTLFANQAFHLAWKNTLAFLGVSIPLLIALSLMIALVVEHAPSYLKTIYLMPLALPVASLALLWQVLFDGSGLVNALTTKLGLVPVDWLQSGASFWVLVISYLWKNIGYDMVLLLGGLSNISRAQYEAAQIDGAGRWRQFLSITLPNLRPTLFVTVVLSTLNAFKVFREAYLVAGNYPHERMYLLQHLFNNWFLHLDIDKLTTAATLVAAIMLGLIALLDRGWGVDRS